MLAQLGISRMCPGPSGNPGAPNAANVDETQAHPYPNFPEFLLVSIPHEVWAVNPASGKLKWYAETRVDTEACPMLVADENMTLVAAAVAALRSDWAVRVTSLNLMLPVHAMEVLMSLLLCCMMVTCTGSPTAGALTVSMQKPAKKLVVRG
jgi:hypothetical protein